MYQVELEILQLPFHLKGEVPGIKPGMVGLSALGHGVHHLQPCILCHYIHTSLGACPKVCLICSTHTLWFLCNTVTVLSSTTNAYKGSTWKPYVEPGSHILILLMLRTRNWIPQHRDKL